MLYPNRIGWEIDTLAGTSNTPDSTPHRGNAPVTRVLWESDNLPDGLSISEDGQISGCPTVAGNHESTVKVTTNWGSATKMIKIRVI